MRKKSKHIDIPTSLQEALYNRALTLREMRILAVIVSESYGWNSDETRPLMRAEIAELLHARAAHVSSSIKNLLAKNVISCARADRYGRDIYKINLQISEWGIPLSPGVEE